VAGGRLAGQAQVPAGLLNNDTTAAIDTASAEGQPAVASIYQLDSIVRRAASLQLTADARASAGKSGVTA
jgi:NADH-quinone oxidoreductase subunit G